MVFRFAYLVFILCFKLSNPGRNLNSKPHIILILADDLGWNEVSWHNNRIKTPYMEVCRGLEMELSVLT